MKLKGVLGSKLSIEVISRLNFDITFISTLSEDELELFDVLKKDKLTQEEEKKVKLAATTLLHRLLEESPKVLVQDWYKDTQSQSRVKSAVEEVLDKTLPESYNRKIFKIKCDNVFELIYEYASKGEKWAA